MFIFKEILLVSLKKLMWHREKKGRMGQFPLRKLSTSILEDSFILLDFIRWREKKILAYISEAY